MRTLPDQRSVIFPWAELPCDLLWLVIKLALRMDAASLLPLHCVDLRARRTVEQMSLEMRRISLNSSQFRSRGLTRLLRICGAMPRLRLLALDRLRIGNSGVGDLASSLSRGAAPLLRNLSLSGNRFGNKGMTSLSHAIRDGALSHCAQLLLHGNRIRDGGVAALAQALSDGALPSLSILTLSENWIADCGVARLSEALAAMPRLAALYVQHNQTDPAFRTTPLCTALARGAAPCLREVHMDMSHLALTALSYGHYARPKTNVHLYKAGPLPYWTVKINAV